METDDRIDSLVDRWEELHERGTPLTIDDLCADYPDLAGEVRRRIAALRAIDSALDTETTTLLAPREGPGPDGSRPTPGLPGTLHAPAVYRPQRHHARGGLGEVFTAHQEELGRTVALKRIRPDKLNESARRRFVREAAITARLQHPGIVPVYGLGRDDDGPFYSMPFIRGQTFHEAMDAFHKEDPFRRDSGRRSLEFRGLLQRFIAVCNTMAYAHDQGVVHRDLKPSNIMLGPYGETLVMDWGLAKRIDDADGTIGWGSDSQSPSPSPDHLTATGAVLGTPQYMSPEQAKGEPTGPAGDIFNLGLILYAIMTGRPAFDGARFPGAALLGAVRGATIEPPRQRDPGLPRALEAICLKALAAKPEDRYPSARDLADDIANWLADEPVTAWREPLSLRARRWARRNRTAVAGAAASLVVGVIGLSAVAIVQARANTILQEANAATTRQKNEAESALDEANRAKRATEEALAQREEERKRAEAVLNFLREDVLAAARPEGMEGGLGRDVTVRKAVDHAEPRIAEAFRDQPAVEVDIRNTLGLTYFYMGANAPAIRQYERAVELCRTTLAPDHIGTLQSCGSLAAAYSSAGRIDEAIAMHEANLKLCEARLGPDDPLTLDNRNCLAESYRNYGRVAEAIAMHEANLKLCEARLGPEHTDTLMSRNNLALAYHFDGRIGEAIALDEVTSRLCEAKLGLDHPFTISSRDNLAVDYLVAGRAAEAIRILEVTVKASEGKLGADHPGTLISRNNLAGAYEADGRWADAVAIRRDIVERRRRTEGPDSPPVARDLAGLGENLLRQAKWSEAESVLREARAIYAKANTDDWRRFNAMSLLGGVLMGQGRYAEAEPMVVPAYEGLKAREARIPPRGKPRVAEAAERVVRLYEAWGKPGQAAAWKAKLGLADLPVDAFAAP